MTEKSGLDYAAAGVDYGTLDASKILAQKAARATAVNPCTKPQSVVGSSPSSCPIFHALAISLRVNGSSLKSARTS